MCACIYTRVYTPGSVAGVGSTANRKDSLDECIQPHKQDTYTIHFTTACVKHPHMSSSKTQHGVQMYVVRVMYLSCR